MINILHPKVSTKPPINKNFLIKKASKVSEEVSKEKQKDCGVIKESKCTDCPKFPLGSESNEDCNQNVIQADSYSFDRLCNMINDLENNLSQEHEILPIKTCFLPTEEAPVPLRVEYHDQIQPEKDESGGLCITDGSTYEDIMKFLNTLEQDCSISEFRNVEQDMRHDKIPEGIEELFGFDYVPRKIPNNTSKNDRTAFSKIKEDQLSTALLKLEDREATLKLLKEELKIERKNSCDHLQNLKKEHLNEMQNQKSKYQNVIKRHQKFIEQLIEEKKDLTEKCNALAEKIKESEAKQQREMKVALERHSVELQRARELCMASEKIRRERWLEAKTSKIKEMTVKGLEPELRSMVDQHQQEIQEIRSRHMKELQDVELRTIRRSNQQLEQLRIELTASHDKILSSEKEALRIRFQEKFNEQEVLVQTQQRKFFEQMQLEKKKFNEELSRRDTESDCAFKQASLQFQEKIEKLTRQHEIEKKSLKETMEAEREAWIENFKRQQSIKFDMSEARIRDECNRERDRQIELAIERLEKETRDMKVNLQRSSDNKLRCVKEKYESELQVSHENEKHIMEKFLQLQEKLDTLEIEMEKTESKLGKSLSDLNEETRMVEKLIRERDHAKKLVRQEIESEKRELEEKIASLYKEITDINANRDSHMAQLYSRIKLIITQKDMTIKNATNEVNDFKNKCDHLEKLLDQQRKEYILKSL